MKKLPALLIGNGEKLPPAFLRALAARAGGIFAADGGGAQLARAKITPDAVIGDLDSLSPRLKQRWAARLVHVASQQNTDLEKALRYIARQGFTACVLAGFWGGRADFSIGNLLALLRFARRTELCVKAPHWTLYPVLKSTRLPCTKGKRVSLIAVKNCRGVSVSGLVYPLQNASLPLGTTLTLSNTARGNSFALTLRTGALLVYTEH